MFEPKTIKALAMKIKFLDAPAGVRYVIASPKSLVVITEFNDDEKEKLITAIL